MSLPLQIDTKVDPDVALTFVIVGGSIAGLATAFALQTAGHHCHVLEASSKPRGGCGPIRSPPNMTKILDAWDIGTKLRERGITKSAIIFRDGDSSEMIGMQKLSAPVMKQFGADFLAFQHNQLYEVLLETAKLAGVSVRTGVEVASIDTSAPAAVLDGGERVEGDIVIGAGGFGSIVREHVVGSDQIHGTPDARLAYNFSIPLDLARSDPELKHLTETDEWQIWMGNHCCLQGFAQPSNSQYAMLLKAPTHDKSLASETWEDVRPFDLATINTDGLGSTALKLMGLAKEVMVTQHVAYEPFEHWVHEENKVLIIGDAAHPLVPSGSQSAAMAIEDAAALGSLFSLYSDRAQLPVLLSAFEDLRQPRCSELQSSERAKTDFVSQPRGSDARKARDAGFKFALEADLLLEDAPEEEVRTSLQDYVGQWTYNALEAVQDWWITYGGMVESRSASEKRRSRGLSLTTEVKLEVQREQSIMA